MSENKCPICGSELAKLEPVQRLGWGCNFQCNPEDLPRIAAAMDAKARHNALVEARETISECLQDTAFRNGVKAGWNAALIKDDAGAEKQYALLMADNNGRLKTLKAARAEVDRLIANDAADCEGEG